MSRLSAISPADAQGLAQNLFSKIKASVGKVPNAYATIGTHNPEALEQALALDGALAKSGLSVKEREAIRITVSAHAGCDYCVAAHSLLGKMAGYSPDELRQLRHDGDVEDTKLNALTRFVRTVQDSRGTVPAAEVAALRAAGYSERDVISIALTIAAMTFSNLVNRINDTELDFPAVND